MQKTVQCLLVVLLILTASFHVGCASKTNDATTTADAVDKKTRPAKILKGQNSYYYYLVSKIKNDENRFGEAEELLDAALKRDEKSSFLWSQKAMFEAQKQQFDKALSTAESSLNRDPKSVDTLILLGKLHAAKREPKKAVEYYQKALAIDRQIEEVYTVMAREYLSDTNPAQAERTLKNCLAEIPESLSCQYYLATIQLQNKNYDAALATYENILVQNPENTKILVTIGEIHLQRKDYTKAIAVFEQLKLLEPLDPTHAIRIALTYYENKQLELATQEFEALAAHYPKSDRINYFLGLLYLEQKQTEKAYAYFDNVKPNSQFFKESLTRQIFILRQNGDFDGMLKLLDHKGAKGNIDFGAMRASVLIAKGDLKSALNQVESALAKDKENEMLKFQRAMLLEKTGNWKTAKAVMIELVQKNPESDRYLNYLGYTMLELNDNIDEALDYLARAVAASPNDGHITDSLAWAYFKKGDMPKALELLLKALRQTPNEPTILKHLGDVYLEMKNKNQARSYYERSLKALEKVNMPNDEEEKIIKEIKEKLAGF